MSIDHNSSPSDSENNDFDLSLSFDAQETHDLDDLDGLSDVRARLDTVVSTLVDDATIKTHSVLVHGPSGNGKTHVAEAVAGELATEGFGVGWFRGFDDFPGDEGKVVAQAVREAVDAAPSVLVLDGLLKHRTVEILPHLREELERVSAADEQVLVVATATPGAVSGGTSLPFETSIALDNPDEERAVTLLERYVEEYTAECDVETAVDMDDETLREAAAGMSAEALDYGTKWAFQEADVGGEVAVTTDNLRDSLVAVADNRPSTPLTPFSASRSPETKSRFVEETDVGFDDIGGLDDVKAELRAAIEFPTRFADTYEACDLGTPGVLLHGVPGNGKTMLAKALANEYERTFIAVNGPELKNKYVGQTEKNIRKVLADAREHAPSVLFFDEFDALAGSREEAHASHEVDFVNTLLAELDGFRDTSDVFVIAATNRPSAVDPAALREGRLGRHVHVPMPDAEGVRAIVATHTADYPLAADVTPEWVASELPDGVPAATITGVCNQALRWHAMRRAVEGETDTLEVTREDVRAAIKEYPMPNEDNDPTPSRPSFY